MNLRFHNTLTGRLEPFEPRVPGEAKIYVCGITTYDVPHAGHARTYTTFDVLVRHLKARGLKVTHVRNVTDVDDKIVKRAAETGEAPLALSRRMSEVADFDLAAIGCALPDHAPRVSESMPEIIAIIEKLIANGNAYAAKTEKGTDVYYAVRSFEGYGKLSHRKLDDLLSGARVETGDIKKDPLDFALWKGEPEGTFGWPSPWGNGRPGWHIECSAMAAKFLGPSFDLHGGGMDLIFPHHENEIAQSEAAHGHEGTPFARTWLHGGFLNVDSEKMSKSLGNFVTIRDVLARNDAEALRYFFLGTHYRGPLAFDHERKDDGRVTFPGVDEAERRIDYLYITREALVQLSEGRDAAVGNVLQGQGKVIEETPSKVMNALDRDLNTPQALAAIGELAKAGNEIVMQAKKLAKDPAILNAVRSLATAWVHALDGSCKPLGLLQSPYEAYAKRTRDRRLKMRGLDEKTIDAKVTARAEARNAKDFAKSDELRKELTDLGIEVLDVAATGGIGGASGGSSWRILL